MKKDASDNIHFDNLTNAGFTVEQAEAFIELMVDKKKVSPFHENVAKLGKEIKELDLITKIDLEDNNKVLLNSIASIIGIMFLIAVVILISSWLLMFKL